MTTITIMVHNICIYYLFFSQETRATIISALVCDLALALREAVQAINFNEFQLKIGKKQITGKSFTKILCDL